MEVLDVILPEVTQNAEIWALLLRDEHKGQILAAVFLNLAGTEYALTVGINQNRNDELWMICALATTTVLRFHKGRIQLFEQVRIQITFMVIS